MTVVGITAFSQDNSSNKHSCVFGGGAATAPQNICLSANDKHSRFERKDRRDRRREKKQEIKEVSCSKNA
jgi:hypothetical protein